MFTPLWHAATRPKTERSLSLGSCRVSPHRSAWHREPDAGVTDVDNHRRLRRQHRRCRLKGSLDFYWAVNGSETWNPEQVALGPPLRDLRGTCYLYRANGRCDIMRTRKQGVIPELTYQGKRMTVVLKAATREWLPTDNIPIRRSVRLPSGKLVAPRHDRWS